MRSHLTSSVANGVAHLSSTGILSMILRQRRFSALRSLSADSRMILYSPKSVSKRRSIAFATLSQIVSANNVNLLVWRGEKQIASLVVFCILVSQKSFDGSKRSG